MPPCTTKRRTTKNLKTKNQNCQKIELYGSPTTKELKTGRRGGDGQQGQRGLAARQRLEGRARWWMVEWAIPHFCVYKLGETTEERDRLRNPGLQHVEYKALKPMTEKTCGCWELWVKLPASQESSLERPTGS